MHCSSLKGIIFSGVLWVWVHFLWAFPSLQAAILAIPWEWWFRFLRLSLNKCQAHILQYLYSFLPDWGLRGSNRKQSSRTLTCIVKLANKYLWMPWPRLGISWECSGADGFSIGTIFAIGLRLLLLSYRKMSQVESETRFVLGLLSYTPYSCSWLAVCSSCLGNIKKIPKSRPLLSTITIKSWGGVGRGSRLSIINGESSVQSGPETHCFQSFRSRKMVFNSGCTSE